MADFIRDNVNKDGIDRRGFLQCMAWAGTGVLYSVHGGILKSLPLMRGSAGAEQMAKVKGADFSFIQISDSHIGFSKEANPDVTATLQVAVDRINSAAAPPIAAARKAPVHAIDRARPICPAPTFMPTMGRTPEQMP